jgi:DNA-binding winged helix-turn-helix (wHTH) protein/tetratricopeptide (TPR) repeat protein
MNGEEKNIYEFESFRLDVAERQLLNNGVSVSLAPKAFDVLAELVERNGHLIEKSALLDLVWADSFVEEASLPRIVHTLRKALGDERNEHTFIETVAKKGYRFVAEVKEVSEPSAVADGFNEQFDLSANASNEKLQPPAIADGSDFARKHKTRIILFSIGFASAVFLILLLSFNRQPNSPVNTNEVRSIAVLPVKPINTNDRDPIYELGIAESLILKLNLEKSLTVRPLSATRKYLELDQNPNDAGKEQQVNFVLSSNYQLADGKILVTSQLINVQTGSVESVFKSETDTVNKFLMQDTITDDIGNLLLARFGSRENNLTAERGTTNEEAYRLYLKAGYVFEEWKWDKVGTAIEYLEQAVELDPNYAPAQVKLAYAYQWLPTAKSAADTNEYYKKSKTAIEKALALDESSADAHAVLGLIKTNNEGDFAGAEIEFKRAIELDPNSAMAHGLYAYCLIVPGRFNEALAENKKAIEFDPASVVQHISYGMILYYARRYDEAEAHYKKMLQRDKNLYYPYMWLWYISDLQGNEPEAHEWFIKYQTQIKTDPEIIATYQTAYQKAGTKGIKREVIKQDEKQITDNPPDLLFKNYLFYEIACFSAVLGDKEKSFEYLEKAYEIQKSTLNWIKVDPALDSLHGDPRFDELVRRVGLN